MNEKTNPGSQEALDQGCTCPILDNRYGKGFTHKGDRLFIMSGDCPLHGFNKIEYIIADTGHTPGRFPEVDSFRKELGLDS